MVKGAGVSIHPRTRIGTVHLVIADLDRSVVFYCDTLGFKLHRREDSSAALGAGDAELLVLHEQPGVKPARGTTGLYHFAVLVPSRQALAHVLHRIVETHTPVQGFADHLVSEAIYLPDPDGNGIEVYRDRPPGEWPRRNGQLEMATDPLDLDSLMSELDERAESWTGLDPTTVIGHIHLHVRDIAEAEGFYRGILGFDLTQRYGPSAAFLSAGGYHHHIGINTWAGIGAPPPPPDAVGLRWFSIDLPDRAALDAVIGRLKAAGLAVETRPEGLFVRDPSQNGILLRADQQ